MDKKSPPPDLPPSYDGPSDAAQARPPIGTPVVVVQGGKDYQAEIYARCARGEHEQTTEYTLPGILLAVLCFPIGLICLIHDSHKKCSRCGVKL